MLGGLLTTATREKTCMRMAIVFLVSQIQIQMYTAQQCKSKLRVYWPVGFTLGFKIHTGIIILGFLIVELY